MNYKIAMIFLLITISIVSVSALSSDYLVGYYPFNNTFSNDTFTKDMSIESFNATVVNVTYHNITGLEYYYFDVSKPMYLRTLKNPLNNTYNKTVTFDIYAKSYTNSNSGIVSDRDSTQNNNYIQIVLTSAGYIRAYMRNNSADSNSSYFRLPLNMWYHIAVVYDDNVTIYANGVMVNTTALLLKDTHHTTNKLMFIGSYYDYAATRNLDGYLDNIRLYNNSLNSTDIMSIYQVDKWGCSYPSENQIVTSDIKLCSETYNLNDSDNNGVFNFTTSNIIFDCNGAIINGSNIVNGVPFMSGTNVRNVTIENCSFINFGIGTLTVRDQFKSINNIFNLTTNITTICNNILFYNTTIIFNMNSDRQTGFNMGASCSLYSPYITNVTLNNSVVKSGYYNYSWKLYTGVSGGEVYIINSNLSDFLETSWVTYPDVFKPKKAVIYDSRIYNYGMWQWRASNQNVTWNIYNNTFSNGVGLYIQAFGDWDNMISASSFVHIYNNTFNSTYQGKNLEYEQNVDNNVKIRAFITQDARNVLFEDNIIHVKDFIGYAISGHTEDSTIPYGDGNLNITIRNNKAYIYSTEGYGTNEGVTSSVAGIGFDWKGNSTIEGNYIEGCMLRSGLYAGDWYGNIVRNNIVNFTCDQTILDPLPTQQTGGSIAKGINIYNQFPTTTVGSNIWYNNTIYADVNGTVGACIVDNTLNYTGTIFTPSTMYGIICVGNFSKEIFLGSNSTSTLPNKIQFSMNDGVSFNFTLTDVFKIIHLNNTYKITSSRFNSYYNNVYLNNLLGVYPYNDVLNITNGALLVINADNFSGVLGSNKGWNIGDYTPCTNWVNGTEINYDSELINYCEVNITISNDLTNITILDNSPVRINFSQLTQWSPFNDVYNVSSASVLSSNVDNFSISLSAGQQIIVGDYTNLTGIVFIVKPINNSYYNVNYSSVNLTVSGAGFSNITINLYNSTGLYLSNQTFTNITSHNFTNLPDDNYKVNATAKDMSGATISSETINFTIDTKKAGIEYISPTPDNATTVTGSINISINITDNSANYTTINVYSENNIVVFSGTGQDKITSLYINNLPNGIYYYNATTCDMANNCNNTLTRTITSYTSGGPGPGMPSSGGTLPVINNTPPIIIVQNNSNNTIASIVTNITQQAQETIINATAELQAKAEEIRNDKANQTVYIIIGIIFVIVLYILFRDHERHKHITRA